MPARHRSILPAAALAGALLPVGCDDATEELRLGGISAPILGGTEVPLGVWNEVSSHNCSGVLIAPRWVLTAGHCGRFNDLVQLAHRTENHRVLREYVYPNWETSFDLALLELETPSSIPPAAVAHGCASRYIVNGAPLAIVGWGATRSYPTPREHFNRTLQEGRLTITDDTCADPADYCLEPGGEFQAGTSTVDTCAGDSGGPAYVLTPLGPLVAGITSRVADLDPALDGSCGVAPGIYVRPDAVVPWIESVLGESLAEPHCEAAPVPVRLPAAALSVLLAGLGLLSVRAARVRALTD